MKFWRYCRYSKRASKRATADAPYVANANALTPSSQGEAFGYKNLGLVEKLIARMLRPYEQS